MAQTVAQLGARTLRKLGVAIVADAFTQPDTATFTAAALATRALREIGIVIPEADRPAPQPIVPLNELGARALRAVGVNPFGPAAPFNDVTYTADVLATRTLVRLEIIDPSETPNTLDQAEALSVLTDILQMLARNGLSNWNPAAIPFHAAEPLILMTAQMLAPTFGKAPSLDTVATAEKMLRVAALSGSDGQAIAEAKIAAVHDGLSAQAIVSWTLDSVPTAQAEDYVVMASVLLSPVMGLNQDAAARQINPATGVATSPASMQAQAWDAAVERVRKAAQIAGAQALAQQRIADVQSELNANNLVGWTPDAIPQAVADAIVGLTAQSLAASFGGKFDPEAWAVANKRVRQVAMGGAAGQALAEAKIRAVHADLDARGKTRFTLFDLPDQFYEPYTLMAAWLLGPEVDVKVDPNWWQMGEMLINRLIALPASDAPILGRYF